MMHHPKVLHLVINVEIEATQTSHTVQGQHLFLAEPRVEARQVLLLQLRYGLR